ncbi:MAG: glycosyltransferase [Phycisphaerae bacterium]
MLRVMMLSTDLEPGGYPLRLARMARFLPDVGVEPIVGCLAPPGPLSAVLASAGIETFACDARGRLDALCLRRLARQVRRLDPAIIHSGLFHANVAVRLAGRPDRSRPVITSTATIEIERRWHLWGEALTSGLSDLHIVNAPPVREHVCNDLCFRRDRVVCVPNGIDLRRLDAVQPADRTEFDIPAEVPLIVWAGRLDPIKNIATFVDIVGEVRKTRDVRALLIGEGPEHRHISTWIARANLGGVIHMTGWRNDVTAWLKTSDVLLFPSRTEGSPNTVIEAMACGCPVVASDLPACRDLIADGIDGWLCPPGDRAAFARAVEDALSDQERRTDRSGRARRRVRRRHDIRSVVRMLHAAYERALSRTQ